MSQLESGNRFRRVKENLEPKGEDMTFESYEAQAAYNSIAVSDQRLLDLNIAENMMNDAFKHPRGILGIDEVIQRFGIPMHVPARTEHERTKRFQAHHRFLLKALLVRDERKGERAA